MGGRGSGSGGRRRAFSGFGIRGNGSSQPDSIIKANAGTHQLHSREIALDKFISMHGNDRTQEHSFTVGEDGFVHGYSHGEAHSVVPVGDLRGRIIYHNHPSGHSFSGQDLLAMAHSGAKGVVAHAVGAGSHILTVNDLKRFAPRRAEWERAVRNASVPQGMDYDAGIAYWLGKNSRKFGIKYQFIPLKKK